MFRTRMLLLATLVLMGIAAVGFHGAQNGAAAGEHALGGAISTPKILWLTWAVGVWFFVTPIVALEGAVVRPLRRVLGAFAALMWARGIAEMLLLYVFFAWRPPYGIAHDAVCVLLLAGGLFSARGELRALTSALDRRVLALAFVLIASLLVEMLYAYLFFRAVEGRTMGADGIWFADEIDPKFIFINRLTTFFNVPLYAFLGVFIWRAFRPAPHAQPAA